MNVALEERTAELRAHDCDRFEAWGHLPFELWSGGALVDFLAGTGWAAEIDLDEPTAAELRAVVSLALGPEAAAFKPPAPARESYIDDDEDED